MPNNFLTSDLVSMVSGKFFYQQSIYYNLSFHQIPEFMNAARQNRSTGRMEATVRYETNGRLNAFGYATGPTLNINLPYYLEASTGQSIPDNDIDELNIAYELTEQDIYSTQYAISEIEGVTQVVGGQMVFMGNPFEYGVEPMTGKKRPQLTDTAEQVLNRYRSQQGLAVLSAVENVMAEKSRTAFWYTPVDRPSKLKKINEFGDISSVNALGRNLNMTLGNMNGIMNIGDANSLAKSLQNNFNNALNSPIIDNAYVGGEQGGRLAGMNLYMSSSTTDTPRSPEYQTQITAGVQQPVATVVSVAADGASIVLSGVNGTTDVIFNAGTKIAIPTVNLFNRVLKTSLSTTLVVTVAQDANGDGAGNVTIVLSEPLDAATGQANVDSLPQVGDTVEIFPETTNNYFICPMGLVSNCLPMTKIHGADNGEFISPDKRCMAYSYAQGVVQNLTNRYRLSVMVPTLAIPRYGINLIGEV